MVTVIQLIKLTLLTGLLYFIYDSIICTVKNIYEYSTVIREGLYQITCIIFCNVLWVIFMVWNLVNINSLVGIF
jgi:hypothetical protein